MTQLAVASNSTTDERFRREVIKTIARHHYCTLATSTPNGKPHVVGVQYDFVDGHLYFITYKNTKKVRNISLNQNVAVCIPVPKYPLAPPLSIQFQGTATILEPQDAEIISLLESGKLKKITGHGVLNQPEGCFLKVTPKRKIHTYGLGIPALTLLRDVSHGDRSVSLHEPSPTGKGGPA